MYQCSQAAYDKLVAQLAELKNVKRPALLDIVSQAQADETNSDENSGFRDAHNQLLRLDATIAELQDRIAAAQIVEADNDGTVRVGSTVTLLFDGESWPVYVGHTIETADIDIVSPDSPLGRALVGRSAGDHVTWAAPSGATLAADVKDIR